MSEQENIQEVKEEVKTRGRKPSVVQPIVDKVAKALSTPYSDKPRSRKELVKSNSVLSHVYFQTPAGVMCRKTYETFRKKSADHKGVGSKYRRLLKVEKNVKMDK